MASQSRAAAWTFLPPDLLTAVAAVGLYGFSVRFPELDEQTQRAHLPIPGQKGSNSNRDGSTRQRRRRQGRPPR